jgi:hypothetical protein
MHSSAFLVQLLSLCVVSLGVPAEWMSPAEARRNRERDAARRSERHQWASASFDGLLASTHVSTVHSSDTHGEGGK